MMPAERSAKFDASLQRRVLDLHQAGHEPVAIAAIVSAERAGDAIPRDREWVMRTLWALRRDGRLPRTGPTVRHDSMPARVQAMIQAAGADGLDQAVLRRALNHQAGRVISQNLHLTLRRLEARGAIVRVSGHRYVAAMLAPADVAPPAPTSETPCARIVAQALALARADDHGRGAALLRRAAGRLGQAHAREAENFLALADYLAAPECRTSAGGLRTW